MKKFSERIKQQLKSLAGPLVIFLVIVAGILVIAFWKEEEEPAEVIKVNGYEGTQKEFVLENDKLKFVMDAATTQFSVTVKETGQVWYSNPQEADEDALALKTEINNLKSTLLLTYSTINGVDTLYNNYTYSMEKGIYEIEAAEDAVKVFYSIGDLDKEYVIPPVITADRMEQFMAEMEQGDMLMVSEYYKKYDINNLGKKDDKEALLTDYPILADEVIYVLRTSKDNIRTKFEKIFEEAGYTYEDYLADKELDSSVKSSDKPVFNVNMVYRLEGDELVVEVPLGEIEYKEDYPLYTLSVLPYFGAAGPEDEGYLFVPEGGGALIDFNNGKIAQNSYFANVYGWDMAQDRDAVVHETRTYFNVFGEAKGDSSFICTIEEGAPYASIQADISGRNNSYNFVNAIYSIVHREQYDVADKYNGEMFVYEKQLPDESLVQRYSFLNSGSYVDMAERYHDHLMERYGENLTLREDEGAPAVIEVIGAVDKVKQILGVPVSRPLELTTYREARQMLEELNEEGVRNMSVKLSGWTNGGIQQRVLSRVKPVSGLGSTKELKSFVASAADMGADVYLNGITSYANDSGLTDGFFVFTDTARFVSKEKAELLPYNTVTYAKRESQDPYYLLNGGKILEMAQNLSAAADKYGASVSFEDIGRELSSDFNEDEPLSRQAAMAAQAAKLKELADSGQKIMLNMGNDYAIAYSDVVTNMDLNGTVYTIIDRTVPFYQLALHGYVNYTGEPINLTQDGQEVLLNSAEYGAGLSFALMKESAFALQKTLYTNYFGADYDAWHDRVVELYTRYDNELGHIFSQRMTGHEFLNTKLTCTTYEDGTRVYVNYSFEDAVTEDGTRVAARDYTVVRHAAD